MRKLIQLPLSLCILSLALLASCDKPAGEGTGKSKADERILPSSQGTHTELLVVMPDELWEGAVGEVFREEFLEPVAGLPKNQPYFFVSQVNPKDVNKTLKMAKSIYWVQLSDTSFTTMQKDVFARPQRFSRITATSERALIRAIQSSSDQMVKEFKNHDLKVVQQRLRKVCYANTHENLRDLGIKRMLLQKGFEPTLDKEDLKMFRINTRKTIQFIMVHERPLDKENISLDDIISNRDSISKNYFEGSIEGSYMLTEMQVMPEISNTTIGGLYAVETRGLWRLEGEYMGGPFLSYTIYDDANSRILTVEGMVYGPSAKKRNVMLDMEGMLKSIILK